MSFENFIILIYKAGGNSLLEEVPENEVDKKVTFVFAFCERWRIMTLHKYILIMLIDTTHGRYYSLDDRDEKTLPYTIRVKHHEAGCGVPSAFMITNSKIQRLLAR